MSLLSLDPVEFKSNVLASCLNIHETVVITSVCHFKRRRIEGSLVCTVHDKKPKLASSSLIMLISGICVTLHHDDVVVLSAPYFPAGFHDLDVLFQSHSNVLPVLKAWSE